MNKTEKKSKFSLRRLIYNDKYLIIFSLLLAVIIWVGTSLNTGTTESKTIKINAPIQLGDEISEQLGMKYYSLQDNVEISVTITGAKYVIGQVTPNDLAISFDTSNVNRTGEQNIPILVSNASRRLDFEIAGTQPSSIEGFFDVNATKVMNLVLDYDESNVAQGYVFGTPVLSEDKVVVSGPKTYIDRLEKTKINIDFDNDAPLTKMFKATGDIEFIGNNIEHSYFTVTSNDNNSTPIKDVSVTIPVLKETMLPVAVDFVDKPSGFSNDLMRIRYSKDSVKAGVLDSTDINSAAIGSINFNTLDVGTQTIDFDVTKLNGIKVLDGTEKITATITISKAYSKKSVFIDKSKIEIEGIPDGYTAVVENFGDNNISVISPTNAVLTGADVKLKCDVSKKADNNEYPVAITLNNDNAWVYGTYNAVVKLTKTN